MKRLLECTQITLNMYAFTHLPWSLLWHTQEASNSECLKLLRSTAGMTCGAHKYTHAHMH